MYSHLLRGATLLLTTDGDSQILEFQNITAWGNKAYQKTVQVKYCTSDTTRWKRREGNHNTTLDKLLALSDSHVPMSPVFYYSSSSSLGSCNTCENVFFIYTSKNLRIAG